MEKHEIQQNTIHKSLEEHSPCSSDCDLADNVSITLVAYESARDRFEGEIQTDHSVVFATEREVKSDHDAAAGAPPQFEPPKADKLRDLAPLTADGGPDVRGVTLDSDRDLADDSSVTLVADVPRSLDSPAFEAESVCCRDLGPAAAEDTSGETQHSLVAVEAIAHDTGSGASSARSSAEAVRVLLIIVGAILTLTLQAVVWYLWVDMAQKSIETPLEQLLLTRSWRSNHIVNGTLNPPSIQQELLVAAAINNEVPDMTTKYTAANGNMTSLVTTRPCELVSYMVGLMKVKPLDFLGIGFEDGSFYMVGWDSFTAGEGSLVIDIVDIADALDCVDNSTVIADTGPGYDPRVRPWYAIGKATKRWSFYHIYENGKLVASADAPVFESGTTTLLGVIFAEYYLTSISPELAEHIHDEESEASYIVEVESGNDFLFGASSGGTSVLVNGSYEGLRAANSPSDMIRYFTTGDLFTGRDVVATHYYDGDPTGDVKRRLVTAWTVEQFYGFIWTPFDITAAVFGLNLVSIIWTVSCQLRGVRLPPLSGIATSGICIFCLYILWVVIVRTNTNSVIEEALHDRTDLLGELMTTHWRNQVWSSTVSSMSYQHGFLPLDDPHAALNTQLDKHFTTMADKYSSYTAYVGNHMLPYLTCTFENGRIHTGWENGDISGYESTTRRIMVRHYDTDYKLLMYNTTTNASGAVFRDALVEDLGSYSSLARPWYQAGRACGRYNNSRYGKTCVTKAYLGTGAGDLMFSLVQPFYDANYTLKGVLSCDLGFGLIHGSLAVLFSSLPEETELAIVQDRGEVVAQSDGVGYRNNSAGDKDTLLVAASTLPAISKWSQQLEVEYGGNFIASQNHTIFGVQLTKTAASCAQHDSWTDERYNPVSDKLSNFTQMIIFPREVYFQPLDEGMSDTFAALVFGCAALMFIDTIISRIEPHKTQTVPVTTETKKEQEEEDVTRSSTIALQAQAPPIHMTEAEEADEQDGAEEDIKLLLSQDPMVLSSNLKRDPQKFEQLYRFASLKLQPTISQLKDTHDSDLALMTRAAEYATLAGLGYYVYTLVMTEQRYGRDSWQVKLFRWLCTSQAKLIRTSSAFMLMLSIFLHFYSTGQILVDICTLLVLSFFTAAWAFYQWLQLSGACLRLSMWIHISALGVTWMLLILDLLDIVELVGLMRPWPLLLASEKLLSTLMVFFTCVFDIFDILSFGFFSVCASAIALFTLYKGVLDPNQGATVNDFLDSFIEMFIFMESADNWENFIHSIFSVSKAGAIMAFAIAIYGIFFLTSMILALFEESYIVNSDTLIAKQRARTRLALTSSFVLAVNCNAAGLHALNTNPLTLGVAGRSSANSLDFASLTKEQCMMLLRAMEPDHQEPDWRVLDFIFTYMDDNMSGSIELVEFEKLLMLRSCYTKLSEQPLLARKSVIARAELLKGDADALLVCEMPDDLKVSVHSQVPEMRAEQDAILASANESLQAYVNGVKASLRVFGKIEIQHLDFACVVLGIGFFWSSTLDGVSVYVDVGFNVLYCCDLAVRIHTMGSLARFFDDPRGSEYGLQNQITFMTSLVGMCGATMVIIEDTTGWGRVGRLWEGLQLAPMLRLFVMNAPYRRIVRALLAGLSEISSFAAVFLVVFYVFCEVAHFSFRDVDITQSQVFTEEIFIGAGWSDVMTSAVQETNHTYNWFFILYRFMVGVLFSQLMVGILIASFAKASDLEATASGEVLHALRHIVHELPYREQLALVKELGVMAAHVLTPAEKPKIPSHKRVAAS